MKKIISILKHNWNMKLFSLIIALIIWFSINNMTTSSEEYYVNLDLKSQLPSNFEVVSNPISVKVRIWGNREIIKQQVTEASFQAKVKYIIDPKNPSITEGINTYKVVVIPKIKLPSDLVSYTYEPKEVQISLRDKIANEIIIDQIRIEPNFSIEPREGYRIKTITIFPESAKIRAKRKILKRIESISTELLEINDIFNTNTFNIAIAFIDPNIEAQMLEPSDKKVRITIEIEEVTKTKDFFDIKINYTNMDDSIAIEDNIALRIFTIIGPSSVIREIKKTDIKPYIDFKGMYNTGEYPKDIKIDFSKKISSKLDELNYFYSPQTLYIKVIKSYKESIQELGKKLFLMDGDRNNVTNENNN